VAQLSVKLSIWKRPLRGELLHQTAENQSLSKTSPGSTPRASDTLDVGGDNFGRAFLSPFSQAAAQLWPFRCIEECSAAWVE
jgi:hypothetical protein